MRNLKKVLSLTLALVMMLGMMTFAGAAETTKVTPADLKDMKDVVNKEQVSLLVDLGVINGIKAADGTYSYNPKGNIERGAYAKMIYTIMMGASDANVYKGVNTGLSDVKGHWAEGFIGYCVSTKIASGNVDKTFTPNANISVVAAAKMLLTALGYDAKASGYENDALWSINIMRDAQSAGLLNNVAQAANDMLTRDSAAQMMYNALFANTVTPKFAYDMGVKYLDEYKTGVRLGLQTFGLDKVTALITDIPGDGYATLGAVTRPVNPLFDASATDTSARTAAQNAHFAVAPTQAGTLVTFYTKNAYNFANGVTTLTNFLSLYSTGFNAAESKVIATVNTGIADFKLTADKTNKKFVAEVKNDGTNFTANFFINGAKETITTKTILGFTDTEFNAAIAKVGAIVEYIDIDSDSIADVVKVTDKAVKTLTADPSTKAVTGADTQVKVPGVINAFTGANTVKTVVGYEGLKKGDVVLTVTVGKITYIEKAASVEGKVSTVSSQSGIKVADAYYGDSTLTGASNSWSNDFANTYKFSLDNSGHIVRAEKLTQEVTGTHAVVLDIVYVTDSVAPGAAAAGHAEALVLHTDGTTEVVKVDTIDGCTPLLKGDYSLTPNMYAVQGATNTKLISTDLDAQGDTKTVYYGAASSATRTKTDCIAISGVNADTELEGLFYTYTTDSKGVYTLTSVATDVADATKIVNGKPNLTTDGDVYKATASANTVFLVKTGTAAKPVYTAYKGIAAVPGMTTAQMEIIVKDGIATYVYAHNSGTLTGTVGEYVYVPATVDTNDDGTKDAYSYKSVAKADGSGIAYYEVDAIVNGVATTIKTKAAGTVAAVNTMYTVTTKDADGVISLLGAVESANIKTGITVVGGTMVVDTKTVSGTNVAYTVDADTAIYYIGTDGTVSQLDYTAVTTDKTDKVIVAKGTANGMAEIVYIMQSVAADVGMTAGFYTVNGAGKTSVATYTGTVALTPAGATNDIIKLVDIAVSDGATYVVSGTAKLGAHGSAAAAANTITVVVTAENGETTATINFTFVDSAA